MKPATYYNFSDMNGNTIELRGDLTMEDLVRMGYTEIRLVPPDKPLEPHQWRCDSLPNVQELAPPLRGSAVTEIKS